MRSDALVGDQGRELDRQENCRACSACPAWDTGDVIQASSTGQCRMFPRIAEVLPVEIGGRFAVTGEGTAVPTLRSGTGGRWNLSAVFHRLRRDRTLKHVRRVGFSRIPRRCYSALERVGGDVTCLPVDFLQDAGQDAGRCRSRRHPSVRPRETSTRGPRPRRSGPIPQHPRHGRSHRRSLTGQVLTRPVVPPGNGGIPSGARSSSDGAALRPAQVQHRGTSSSACCSSTIRSRWIVSMAGSRRRVDWSL